MAETVNKTREIELTQGRTASIRPGKGRDLLAAARMAGNVNEPMKLALGIIAQLVTIDGKALTIEDVEDMDLTDVLKLQGEAMGNVPSFPVKPSPN